MPILYNNSFFPRKCQEECRGLEFDILRHVMVSVITPKSCDNKATHFPK